MWWTAVTFAAVAAWFEWQFRRDRKVHPSAEEETAATQPQEAAEPGQPKAADLPKPPAVEPPFQLLEAPPSKTPLTAGRNR